MWSGERATEDDFKLLTLEAPVGPAVVGTRFASTGANFNGTFHDRSVVVEMSRPSRIVIETESRLERVHGKAWEVHFVHQYDIVPDAAGSRITYTDTAGPMNYVPYWLRWWMRPYTRRVVDKGDRQHLENLARLAEERAG